MYPHSENNRSDTVQLLAPDFDSDIDKDNQPTSTTISQSQPSDNSRINANNPKMKDTKLQPLQQDTDWPDAATIQIP